MYEYPLTFSLTFDTDWVPQFILDDVLSLLQDAGLPGTFFCTSPYAPFPATMEAGLHPNFLNGSTMGSSEEECLAFIRRLYPQAIGSRSHCYYWHNRLRNLFLAQGLRYDSSQLLPLQPNLRPHAVFGLTHFPVWYSDGVHMQLGADCATFSPAGLEDPGLKVLLFHPLHIYLNSRSVQESKTLLGGCEVPAVTETLRAKRRSGQGMRTLFLAALKHIRESGAPCRRLCDLL
ncbi:hypothetical protein [uncultured Desulfovibrio sp.]|uniref:polysaccharide deacetylase WbmS family protein n=1 Tax=uncultured Desulfovibrio sp. TaxID=167968 RepID=UPI002602E507|nr:hypothetical protein [uncultured Desulfovibrio sp.]